MFSFYMCLRIGWIERTPIISLMKSNRQHALVKSSEKYSINDIILIYFIRF